MIKKNALNNYKLLIKKMKRIDDINFDIVLKKIKRNVICVGSGASYTTACLSSLILNRYFNKNSYAITPRELLNSKISDDYSIIIYSYSGTSKDTIFIRKKFPNSVIITGRNINEFDDKKNIFSYYLNEDYEKGIILYENIVIPITLLLKQLDSFTNIIKYEIDHFDSYRLEKVIGKKIAIFDGDFTTIPTSDLVDKILETGVIEFDLYEKKNFSHGQYNYFMNNNYDAIVYFKQKNVSEYEKELIKILRNNNKLIIVESEYNDVFATYDLLFKSFILFNNLIEDKNLKLYNNEFISLFKFEGDFS